MINLVYLFVGVLFGLIIGILIGMGIAMYGIKEGGLKDYYYIPFKPSDRDLYAIKEGQLERIMTIPPKEEWGKENEE